MRKLWKKQLPAAVLALIMMISLVPLAGASEATLEQHQHTYSGDWIPDGATGHYRVCTADPNCTVRETDTHHFDNWETSEAATCSKEGTETRTCLDCKYVETNSLPKLSHNYSGWIYESNSTHKRTCGQCSNVERAPHVHSASDKGSVTVEAKCTTGGRITYTCTDCNATYYEDTNALGHLDANKDGFCDRAGCGVSVGTAFTVTFQTPAGSSVIPNQTVLAGQRPKVVSNPSSFTSGGITYTFYGWMQGTSSNYVYTNQQTVNPATVTITGNTTFTALYKTNSHTVTFQSLSSSGNIAVSNQTVQNNGYPYKPSDPSKVTFGGVTYTFKGWTTSYTGSSWYLYTNQPLVTPEYQRINSNATFYAVYTTNDKSTISYTAAAGKETDFDARDFYNAVSYTHLTLPTICSV